jgi:hypothetical protein
MPKKAPRRKSKEAIKEAADRAEGKPSKSKKDYDPLEPVITAEPEDDEGDLMPGGVRMKHPGGRPSKYKPEYAKIAGAMLKRGATINDLAELFDVANRTIHLWQQTHDEFMQQFMHLDECLDTRIERALADRAAGYTYEAVKIFQYEGSPVIVPHKVHVPPDISAIKMWLSSRKPERWKDKTDDALTGAGEAFIGLLRGMSGKKNGGSQNG